MEKDKAQSNFEKGETLYKDKNFDEALIYFDKAININPNLTRAYYGKAMALNDKGLYMAQLNQHDNSILNYNKSIEIWILHENKQKLSIVFQNKGISLVKLEKKTEALECFSKSIESNPFNYSAFNYKGILLNDLKRYNEAIECFDQAIKLNPRDFLAFNNKAVALFKMENMNEALKYIEKALEINPDFADAYNNKGLICFGLNQCDKSIKFFNKALELDSKLCSAYKNKEIVKDVKLRCYKCCFNQITFLFILLPFFHFFNIYDIKFSTITEGFLLTIHYYCIYYLYCNHNDQDTAYLYRLLFFIAHFLSLSRDFYLFYYSYNLGVYNHLFYIIFFFGSYFGSYFLICNHFIFSLLYFFYLCFFTLYFITFLHYFFNIIIFYFGLHYLLYIFVHLIFIHFSVKIHRDDLFLMQS